MKDAILPGLPVDLIIAAYGKAPGGEIESGKFAHPESSAALAANTFGLFLDRAADLPPLPDTGHYDWPATSVSLEAELRFPWRGGRHPWLDALVATKAALIGIESKRYEPFRSKSKAYFSETYWRPVWGERMSRYERVRDRLHDGTIDFAHLDAAQLIKHAFGLRSATHGRVEFQGKLPVLYYLYAEPQHWPDGRDVPEAGIEAHRVEVVRFAELVAGDEVAFHHGSYAMLLSSWEARPDEVVRRHARVVKERFAP